MKTVLTAVIVMAGLAYAGDFDPPKGPVSPTMHTLEEIYAAVVEPTCCSPRPEDIRFYHVFVNNSGEPTIVIPKVEGTNGFLLTDVIGGGGLMFQDTGDGPVQIFKIITTGHSFTMGLPLIAGSAISFLPPGGVFYLTLIGYVY